MTVRGIQVSHAQHATTPTHDTPSHPLNTSIHPPTRPPTLPSIHSPTHPPTHAGRTHRFFTGAPTYPFGHGLTYSSFTHTISFSSGAAGTSAPAAGIGGIAAATAAAGGADGGNSAARQQFTLTADSMEVTVTVKNTGRCAVAQVHGHWHLDYARTRSSC